MQHQFLNFEIIIKLYINTFCRFFKLNVKINKFTNIQCRCHKILTRQFNRCRLQCLKLLLHRCFEILKLINTKLVLREKIALCTSNYYRDVQHYKKVKPSNQSSSSSKLSKLSMDFTLLNCFSFRSVHIYSNVFVFDH